MGNASLVFVLFLLPNMVSTRVTISDVVATDTSFYYRQFQMPPSKLATLDNSVMFNRTRVNGECERDICKVILDIYTNEHDKNLKINCSNDGFGQLMNENLRTPLYLRNRPYRFTTCKLEDMDLDMLHCEGRTIIQDYIPRKYGFSFGYDCGISTKPSIFGLSFNITISEQSNKTKCLRTHQNLSEISCHEFYDYMSLPNMIGDPNIAFVNSWAEGFKKMGAFVLYFLSMLPTEGCYKHMNELFCHIIFPKCDQVENQMIPPCKETLSDFLHGCLKYFREVFEAMPSSDVKLFRKWRTKLAGINISTIIIDSDYLPSITDSIPCSYKPVICDQPPNVTNARIIKNTEPYGTYLAMSQVEYECVNETFQMEGNSTVTCLYIGEWYKIPKCLKRSNKSPKMSNLNPLSIVLPLLILPLFILILSHLIWRHVCLKKKAQEYFTRIKDYDAFVCYEYNEVDQDFAEKRIRMELEEKCHPPFKLCLHRRDFRAAWDIMWNIRNAIQNSNSAIIVMSQDYVDSLWCKEEFEQCYIEHMKDPAFKLFVILMQPVEELEETSEYMKSFFASKVYLERNDPKLFKKISDCLIEVKKPKDKRKIRKVNTNRNLKEQEMEELI